MSRKTAWIVIAGIATYTIVVVCGVILFSSMFDSLPKSNNQPVVVVPTDSYMPPPPDTTESVGTTTTG